MGLPAVPGVAVTDGFSATLPSHVGRSVGSTPVPGGYCSSTAHAGVTSGTSHGERGSFVLTVLFMRVGVCVCLQGLFSLFFPDAVPGVLESGIGLAMGTSLTVAMLPVVGTGRFWVMCSQRVSLQWGQAVATDPLTRLPSRRTLITKGEGRLNSGRRRDDCVALAGRDIDPFKPITDRCGHEPVDLALRHLALVLKQHCRGPSRLSFMASRRRSPYRWAWR